MAQGSRDNSGRAHRVAWEWRAPGDTVAGAAGEGTGELQALPVVRSHTVGFVERNYLRPGKLNPKGQWGQFWAHKC